MQPAVALDMRNQPVRIALGQIAARFKLVDHVFADGLDKEIGPLGARHVQPAVDGENHIRLIRIDPAVGPAGLAQRQDVVATDLPIGKRLFGDFAEMHAHRIAAPDKDRRESSGRIPLIWR